MRRHATGMPPRLDTRRWACQRVKSGQADALQPVPLAGRDGTGQGAPPDAQPQRGPYHRRGQAADGLPGRPGLRVHSSANFLDGGANPDLPGPQLVPPLWRRVVRRAGPARRHKDGCNRKPELQQTVARIVVCSA
jgi:hypothetical protein